MSDQSYEVLRLEALRKSYNIGQPNEVEVLHGIDLSIQRNDFAALIGPSGSGKSTLLNILGLLDKPTSGELYLLGQPTSAMQDAGRTALRGNSIGFVFQFHHLLPEFTTLENVAMPGIIQGMARAKSMALAREALEMVGLGERMEHRVTTLSGGERQRAAIARAILLKPRVLLADEPTGNLDEKTGEKVGRILLDLNRDVGMALIIVTHNSELAGLMHRRYELKAGELYEQSV